MNPIRAILFDLHGTLMVDMDRFGPDQDYAATFREVGGHGLDESGVRAAIDAVLAVLVDRYNDPSWQDRFPAVATVIDEVLTVEAHTARALEQVIARHEIGQLCRREAEWVRRVARRYRLGVISNLYSRKQPWLDAFQVAGVADCFSSVTVSSDGPHIKPSTALFHAALEALGSAPADTLMVGDDYARDIAPAMALGLSTVWITTSTAPAPGPEPGWRVRGVVDLERLSLLATDD